MNKDKHFLKRLWLSILMVIGWGVALFTVNFPSDHFLPFSPILMYVVYGLLGVISLLSLVFAFVNPKIADVILMLVPAGYFVLFTIIFIKRLLMGWVPFFPLITISLFVMAIVSFAAFVLLMINKNRLGYLLSIVVYSFFLMSVIFESYPIAEEAASEVYTNIKLVYFVAIITASILGIINSVQMMKLHK